MEIVIPKTAKTVPFGGRLSRFRGNLIPGIP